MFAEKISSSATSSASRPPAKALVYRSLSGMHQAQPVSSYPGLPRLSVPRQRAGATSTTPLCDAVYSNGFVSSGGTMFEELTGGHQNKNINDSDIIVNPPLKTIYMPDSNGYLHVCQQQQQQQSLSDEDVGRRSTGDSGCSRQCRTVPGEVVKYRVHAALLSLLAVGLPAGLMCLLATQLLMHVTQGSPLAFLLALPPPFAQKEPSKPVKSSFFILPDFAAGCCAVTLSFSLAAFFTAFLQLFFSLKSLKASMDSDVRILGYLHQGTFLRLVSFVGFFISIPVFIVAVFASLLLEKTRQDLQWTPTASVFTVIGGMALLVCLATLLHAMYAWLWGLLKPPEFGGSRALANGVVCNKLSTLV